MAVLLRSLFFLRLRRRSILFWGWTRSHLVVPMEYSISSNASKHLIVRTNHPSHHHGVHESLLRASVRTQLESADDDGDQTTRRHRCADDDAHATRDFDDRDVHRAQ